MSVNVTPLSTNYDVSQVFLGRNRYKNYTYTTSVSSSTTMITQGWAFASASNVYMVGLSWLPSGGFWQLNVGVVANPASSTTLTVYYYYQ